jgi:putative membrane protein
MTKKRFKTCSKRAFRPSLSTKSVNHVTYLQNHVTPATLSARTFAPSINQDLRIRKMESNSIFRTKFLQPTTLIVVVMLGLWAFYTGQDKGDIKQVPQNNFAGNDANKDAQFLIDAGEICIEEIKLGQLAQKKSINIDIQEFGKTLEDAYTKMLNELIPLAKSKSIIIPIAMTDKSQQTYNQLVATPLNYFNKAYCDIAVSRHQEAGVKFQKVFTESTDEDTRRWALSKLPELRRHLEFSLVMQKKSLPMN